MNNLSLRMKLYPFRQWLGFQCGEQDGEQGGKPLDPNIKIVTEEELCQEHLLLVRIDELPKELQKLVAEFSPVVQKLKRQAKFEFFDTWLNENTQRIMSLLDGWTKPQVGTVLTHIIRLEEPNFTGYLEREACYLHWPVAYMRKQIKVYISHRTKKPRPDIIADLAKEKTYIVHKFVPCVVNPAFDECPPIRVWGAYKAIEEYDARLIETKNATKSKKSNKAKK
jgi:hypothetical protein